MMTGWWRMCLALAALGAWAVPAPAAAQALTGLEPHLIESRSSRGGSPQAALDKLLAHGQYAALGEALEREHKAGRGRASRSWQERRMRNGGSAYLGFVFSRELLRSATGAAARQRARLREKAAFVALYTMAVLTIDGPRCADAAASSLRSEQLFDLAAEAFSWAAEMPEARRDLIIDGALALERATVSLRQDDGFICLGGVGAAMLQVPGPDSEPIQLPELDQQVDPQFVGDETSRPLQALARRTIRADLCRMLDQMRG